MPPVVHLFGQGVHPEIRGFPIGDEYRTDVSEVALTEGAVQLGTTSGADFLKRSAWTQEWYKYSMHDSGWNLLHVSHRYRS